MNAHGQHCYDQDGTLICGWPEYHPDNDKLISASDFEVVVRRVIPFASFDEDNDGQLIIYTGYKIGKDGYIRVM